MISQWQLLYQITPIWLKDGIVTQSNSGNMLPLLAILNADAFNANFMGAAGRHTGDVNDWTLDDAFGIFQPTPGGSLVQQSIAEYPFANLNVAANAIVRNPIGVSLIMLTPMKTPQAWSLKMSTMTALKQTLDNHNNAGGVYVVFTPGFIYQNMLMTSLTDVSTAQSVLPQNAWRWDFTRPLVQLSELANVESNLISKITGALPVGMNTVGGVDITAVMTAMGQPSSSVNVAPGAGGTYPSLTGFPIQSSLLH
jgi:hypothetical protein